jgi:two-component system sensor histidine kinase KdpD
MTFHLRLREKSRKEAFKWRGYLIGLGLVVLATLLGHLVQTFFAPTNIIMIYLLCITISAVVGGLGPSILVSILGVLAFDFFFVTPFYTFAVNDTQYIFTFIILLLVGITISYLTSRIRQQTEAAKQRERETAALYALGRDLAISGNLESYIKAIAKRIKEALGCEVIIFLPDAEKQGKLIRYISGIEASFDKNELSTAAWSFQRRQKVFPDDKTQYLPLVTARGVVGVIELKVPDTARELTTEQERLLGAYTDLVAVAIEGIKLAEELQNAQVMRATEKLQAALLNAISHDLRTPLVSVIGTLSSLQEEGMGLDDNAKKNLIQVAREEADRLNHLITNLLDESRIEAGAIVLSKQPSEVQDLVGAALEQLGSRASARSIKIDIPADIPFILVDFGLIVQTLYNILDNAMKYSPTDAPIEIKARQLNREIHIEITDHGIGVPEQDLANIFDKFYRIKRPDNVAGTGLGLSISKGIVEAHGGSIKAEKGTDGGTVIRIELPMGDSDTQSTVGI